MKCGFCGNELEQGSEICPNCGMIISLGGDDENREDKVVESVYNVFKSNVTNENNEKEKAQELEADPTEEKVEFVMSLPEFDEAAEPIKSQDETKAEEEFTQESSVEEAPQIEEEIDTSLPEMDEIPLPDTLMGDRITGEIYSNSEDYTDNAEEAEEDEKSEDEVQSDDEYSAEEDKLDIRVPESNYIYSEYDDYGKTQSEETKLERAEKNEEAKKNLDKISPDEKKKPVKKNKKKGQNGIDGIKIEAVLGVAIVIIVVLFGCAYAAKNNMIPVIGELFGDNTTTTQQDETSNEAGTSQNETSEEATSEVVTSEESTAEETTTEKETTTKPTTTEKETTTKADKTTEKTTNNTPAVNTTRPTTKPSTTKPSTTKPSTTKPTTTKPSTTKPSTTKPSTTKPTTTKPSTTKDPYGINNVKVQKPSSYLSKSYTAYVTAEGVILRNKPSTSSDKILCLSKGADVKVLAKQNGFYYIYSNRYGVYGWVSASYIVNERPTSNSTTISGTVAPDKKYDTVQTKYTTNGLYIRKGPGQNYSVIGLIPISYPVKVIGYKSGVSGWVYVQDTTYGYTGWVSTAYLK